MPRFFKEVRSWLLVGILCSGLELDPRPATAADTFTWHTNTALVSADIKDAKLPWLLEEITSATGWRVFVEPDVSYVVSAKFQNRPPGDALRLLLGDLNFALIPESGGHSKLFVFRTAMGNATQRVQVSTNIVGGHRPIEPPPGASQRRARVPRPNSPVRPNE